MMSSIIVMLWFICLPSTKSYLDELSCQHGVPQASAGICLIIFETLISIGQFFTGLYITNINSSFILQFSWPFPGIHFSAPSKSASTVAPIFRTCALTVCDYWYDNTAPLLLLFLFCNFVFVPAGPQYHPAASIQHFRLCAPYQQMVQSPISARFFQSASQAVAMIVGLQDQTLTRLISFLPKI